MAVRHCLATLIVTLLVGLAPIPALAVAIGGATAQFHLGPDFMLTFSNDSSDQEDIVRIVLYGTTAAELVTWEDVGFETDPAGANSSIAGEQTPVVTIDFVDVAGPSAGFNPGEGFFLFSVDACLFCEDVEPGNDQSVTLADLIDVEVEFTFEDDSTISGVFEPKNPANPEEGLTLRVIPEPGTAILLALGLSGLAASGRRLA